MPDDQAAPDQGSSGLSTEEFLAGEQTQTPVEEQSNERTDEGTPADETSEESVEAQLRAQLATAQATNADTQTKLDELNRTFTQDRQAAAEQLRQEQAQPQQADYSQYPEESRAAMQELDRRIDERAQQIVEAKFGGLNEQVEGLTATQQKAVEMAAVRVAHPGVSEAEIEKVFNDPNISTREIIARSLAGSTAATTAAAKTKADLTRKAKANTGSGTGGTPTPGKIRPYDSKRDSGKTAMQIMNEAVEFYESG